MTTLEPTQLEECGELLGRAARERQRVAFVGGGTALEVGNVGTAPDVILSTRRLDRVVEYAPEDQVIVAEAALTLGRLRELAAPNAQWFGVDAPLADRATLGGLVAVGAFGPRRLRYGGMRELLLGITLVRADGASALSGSSLRQRHILTPFSLRYFTAPGCHGIDEFFSDWLSSVMLLASPWTAMSSSRFSMKVLTMS